MIIKKFLNVRFDIHFGIVKVITLVKTQEYVYIIYDLNLFYCMSMYMVLLSFRLTSSTR